MISDMSSNKLGLAWLYFNSTTNTKMYNFNALISVSPDSYLFSYKQIFFSFFSGLRIGILYAKVVLMEEEEEDLLTPGNYFLLHVYIYRIFFLLRITSLYMNIYIFLTNMTGKGGFWGSLLR